MVSEDWLQERERRIETEELKRQLRFKYHELHEVYIGPNSIMYAMDGDPILYLSKEDAILGHHEFVVDSKARDIPPGPVRIYK